MSDESFAETLKKQLFCTDNLYTIIKRTEKKEFIDFAEETIYTFEIHGNFLNNVPIEERNRFNDKIISWINNLYDDLSRIKNNNKIYTRASDKKKSDLKAISTVREIIGKLPSDIECGKELYSLLDELSQAIKGDTNKKVLAERYYKSPLTDKKVIRNVISEMIEIYKIPKAIKATEELMAKLPTAKNIS